MDNDLVEFMNRDSFGRGMLAGFLVTFLIMFVCAFMFCGTLINSERQKAIDAGVGYWTVDPRTGDKSFHYGVAK